MALGYIDGVCVSPVICVSYLKSPTNGSSDYYPTSLFYRTHNPSITTRMTYDTSVPRLTIPATMRAMAIAQKQLVGTSLATPRPRAGELLIRVAYAGVNRADIMQIDGHYPPPIGATPLPGLEVSGWVVALGEGVSGVAVGDEVCALLSGGGYAEFAVASAGQVLQLPKGIGLKAAASLPEAAATGMMALVEEGRLSTGERVLIHGGASGVGILMTQIATYLGGEVFATVNGAQKAEFIKQFNITPIDCRLAPFGEQLMARTQNEGVDLIIDTLGGPQLANHLRLLRPGGRLISLAMLEGSEIADGTKMTRLVLNGLTWRGATLRSRSDDKKAALMKKTYEKLWPALEKGAIKPHIDGVFTLNDAKKALNRMQERLHMGKILLEVAPK